MTMQALSLCLIGAGRMGTALLEGWLRDDMGVAQINIIEPFLSDDLKAIAENKAVSLNATPRPYDVLIMAVKPQVFLKASEAAEGHLQNANSLASVMAGITIDQLRAQSDVENIIRAMPNTPGAIGQGITAYSVSGSKDHLISIAEGLLSPLGDVVGPLDESDLDAVTALSGSGPAYIFRLVEVLAEAGMAAGLDEALAMQLARKTVEGSAALLAASSSMSASELREAVTSPNGTTAAALNRLNEGNALELLFTAAIEAAKARSVELSKA